MCQTRRPSARRMISSRAPRGTAAAQLRSDINTTSSAVAQHHPPIQMSTATSCICQTNEFRLTLNNRCDNYVHSCPMHYDFSYFNDHQKRVISKPRLKTFKEQHGNGHIEKYQWYKQDQILKTKTKTAAYKTKTKITKPRPRPRPPEVNKGT